MAPAVYIWAQHTADRQRKNTCNSYDATWPVILPQNICVTIPKNITFLGLQLEIYKWYWISSWQVTYLDYFMGVNCLCWGLKCKSLNNDVLRYSELRRLGCGRRSICCFIYYERMIVVKYIIYSVHRFFQSNLYVCEDRRKDMKSLTCEFDLR